MALLVAAIAALLFFARTRRVALAILALGFLLPALGMLIGNLHGLLYWNLFGPMTEEKLAQSVLIANAVLLLGQLLDFAGYLLLMVAALMARGDWTTLTRIH